jgi:histidyl-tRNA synthetase
MTGLSAAHLIAVSDSPFRRQRGAEGTGRFYLRRKSTMARTASLSGFPEWLPEERLVELHVLDTLRQVFELHGFSSIETRAVETVGQLLRKGEIDKEVYGLSRLQDDDDAAGTAPDAAKLPKGDPHALALHFDLTVPFARYVVENAGYLAFPFRRYQIQKVWRGERPQEGRAREFTQADIDIVGDGDLPFRYDVEIALVIAEALSALPIPAFLLRINNRKLAEGFYNGIGLTDTAGVLRSIDKLEKIGPARVAELLKSELGATEEQAQSALKLASIRTEDTSFVEQVRALGVSNELLEEGLTELEQVIAAAVQRAPGKVVADLSIARGLDYYTGTVVETVLVGHEQLGSICSGGRYDALASKGNRKFPGVGLSIGVTRLVSRILSQDLAKATRSVPTAVLVALTNDDSWGAAQDVAAALRGRGIATEVAAKAEKFGKQIKFADRRGIPFVWFTDEDGKHQVKDIRSGEQVDADPATWAPAAEDLHVRVLQA